MSFETLSSENTNVHPVIESYSITKSFLPATLTITKGTVVKLLASGKVTPVTSKFDYPMGTCIAGSDSLTKEATIQTNFCAIKLCEAAANIAPGQKVMIDSHNASMQPIVRPATERFYAYGMCITGATTGGTAVIGVFRMPDMTPSS